MSKINISQRKLDLDKLLSEIRSTKCEYIIMNSETLNELDKVVDDVFTKLQESQWGTIRKVTCSATYPSIWDIPIAVCEKLKYGEVDLV